MKHTLPGCHEEGDEILPFVEPYQIAAVPVQHAVSKAGRPAISKQDLSSLQNPDGRAGVTKLLQGSNTHDIENRPLPSPAPAATTTHGGSNKTSTHPVVKRGVGQAAQPHNLGGFEVWGTLLARHV